MSSSKVLYRFVVRWPCYTILIKVGVIMDHSSTAEISAKLQKIYELMYIQQTRDLPFKEARKQIFHGKSREWIRYYIIRTHEEILTSHGGWLTDPRGRGSRMIVTDSVRAKQWVINAHDIDWSLPEPKNIAV